MTTITRLMVLMTALEAGLVSAACASPTDDSMEPAAQLGAAEAAESTGKAKATSALASEELDREAPGRDTQTLKARCNYRDAAHCIGAEQGWRWVPIRRRARSVDDTYVVATGKYCCMRAGPRPPPMPEE